MKLDNVFYKTIKNDIIIVEEGDDMYQALYRKYRPKNFDEVTGQEVIIRTLENEISKNKISHAYLFTGPRGTGKTSVAKLMAKVINCESPNKLSPCGKCVVCTQTQNIDIIEIDAASNNGVDEIREIRNKVNLVPSLGKYKVYIIDEVHMLTTGAFNALLKTLEEPPAHAIFILATTDPHKIPATILSRCQRFDFKKIQEKSIIDRLKYIVHEENIKIDDDALKEIAFLSDGGMRDAISILDQAISYCDEFITSKDIQEIVGTISNREIDTFFDNLFSGEITGALDFIDECNSKGKNLIKVSEKIMYYLKDRLITSVQNDESFHGLNKTSIIDLIKDMNDTISAMKKSNDPKLLYDLFIIKNSGNKEKKIDKLNSNNIEQHEKENEKTKIEITKKQVSDAAVLEKKAVEKEEHYTNLESTTNAPKRANNFPGNKNEAKLTELINLRINNTLAGFSRKDLLDFKKNIYKIEKLLLNPDYSEMASLMLDGEIKAVGNNSIIFVYQTDTIEDIFNHKILEIEDALSQAFNHSYKVVATNSNDWEIIKKQFNSKEKQFKYVEETEDMVECLLETDTIEEDDIDSMFGSIVEYN